MGILLTPSELRTRPIGLRVVLASYVLVDAALAVLYWLGPAARFSGPAFSTALHVAPLHVWSVLFALEAVWIALTWKHRVTLAVGLLSGMMLYLFWAFCFILSAKHSLTASYTGAPIWGLAAVVQVACTATILSPRKE